MYSTTQVITREAYRARPKRPFDDPPSWCAASTQDQPFASLGDRCVRRAPESASDSPADCITPSRQERHAQIFCVYQDVAMRESEELAGHEHVHLLAGRNSRGPVTEAVPAVRVSEHRWRLTGSPVLTHGCASGDEVDVQADGSFVVASSRRQSHDPGFCRRGKRSACSGRDAARASETGRRPCRGGPGRPGHGRHRQFTPRLPSHRRIGPAMVRTLSSSRMGVRQRIRRGRSAAQLVDLMVAVIRAERPIVVRSLSARLAVAPEVLDLPSLLDQHVAVAQRPVPNSQPRELRAETVAVAGLGVTW